MSTADFMTYLIKCSGLLFVFWGIYSVALKKETFFHWNRIYLVSSAAFALVLPLCVITKTEIITLKALPLTPNRTVSIATELPNTLSLQDYLLMVYLAGAAIFLLKLIVQLLSLQRLLRKGSITKMEGYSLVKTDENTTPFSFFRFIVVNESLHTEEELKTMIAHEQIHVKDRHSLDILFMHLLTVVMWINPFAWLLKRDTAQNLEFIADKGASRHNASRKEYQYLLLKNHIELNQLSIINPFFNSLIKNRIVMLHQDPSKSYKLWKLSLALPVMIAFIFLFNIKTVAQFQHTATTGDNTAARNQQAWIQERVEFIITKEMSDAQLADLKKEISAEGGELKWKKLKRNDAGLITGISIEFSYEGNLVSGSYQNNEGIPNIVFGAKDKSNLFLKAGSTADSENRKMVWVSADNSEVNEEKVFVVRKDSKELYFTDNDSLLNTHWTTADDSTKVMKIRIEEVNDDLTWSVKEGDSTSLFVFSSAKLDSLNPTKFQKKIIIKSIGDEDETKIISGGSEEDVIIELKGKDDPQHGVFSFNQSGEPLYLIDGKESSQEEMKNLSPSQIKNVEVLKGKKAKEEFGDKAKNGVVKITTKKENE